jgi:hypothetical protein
MHDGFVSLDDFFNKEPKFSGLRSVIKAADVVEKFSVIFPELNKTVEPVKVEKKILFLKVENAALRNELKFNEYLLAEKINNFFKEVRVKTIKFI